MNEIERKQKALENLNKFKAEIAEAVSANKKAVAKSKRDAKKSPKISNNTFGDIIMLNSAYNKCQYYGFIYQIEIGTSIYIGKKSFGSKSDWRKYKSSSEPVRKLIKRAAAMGIPVAYKAISLAHDSLDLQKAEIAQIHLQWSKLAAEGRLNDSLNIDDGSGLLNKTDWFKHYYLGSI